MSSHQMLPCASSEITRLHFRWFREYSCAKKGKVKGISKIALSTYSKIFTSKIPYFNVSGSMALSDFLIVSLWLWLASILVGFMVQLLVVWWTVWNQFLLDNIILILLKEYVLNSVSDSKVQMSGGRKLLFTASPPPPPPRSPWPLPCLQFGCIWVYYSNLHQSTTNFVVVVLVVVQIYSPLPNYSLLPLLLLLHLGHLDQYPAWPSQAGLGAF